MDVAPLRYICESKYQHSVSPDIEKPLLKCTAPKRSTKSSRSSGVTCRILLTPGAFMIYGTIMFAVSMRHHQQGDMRYECVSSTCLVTRVATPASDSMSLRSFSASGCIRYRPPRNKRWLMDHVDYKLPAIHFPCPGGAADWRAQRYQH